MKVSVVMPVLNGGKMVLDAVASIAAQSHGVDEFVLIDDGSTDGTGDRVHAATRHLSVSLLLLRNETNLGIARSLDRGVRASCGDLVLRLDADDRWLPSHVAALVAMARRDANAVLFSSRVRLVDEDRGPLGESPVIDARDIRWKLAWDNPLTHSATGFRRQAYLAAGGYRPTFRWEDYDLWIRLLQQGDAGFCNDVTMEYTVASNSLSRIGRRGMRDRLALQRRAARAFFRHHPVRIAAMSPAILTRTLIETARQ